MTLILSNSDVESLLMIDDYLEVIERAFSDFGAGHATNRPRALSYYPLEPDHYYLFSSMDGSLPRQGVHLLRLTSDHIFETSYKGVTRREKLPKAPNGTFCGLVLLFSLETLELLAIFQDAVLNRWMIGATAGVAAKYMSRPESRTMAQIGSGWLAYTHVLAHCAVRPIERITVYSPNEAHRETLCRDLKGKVDAELISVDSARTAMKDVDIVSAVTNSYEPVFSGDWLEPGQYVTSVQGSELDDRTPDRAAIIVTRAMEPATFAAPPGCEPKEADWFRRWRSDWRVKLRELGRIVAGSQAGRDSPEDITLFGSGGTTPSHGIAIQYAAAAIAYRRARERGLGYEVPSELFLEAFHP